MVVRELTGGIYFGPRQEATEEEARAYDTMVYTADEIRHITHIAFRPAQERRGKVTLVDNWPAPVSGGEWCKRSLWSIPT